MNILGWRKMSAWLLVFALVCVATYNKYEIPANNVDLVKWVTAYFFVVNGAKPAITKVVEKLTK